MKFVKNPLKHPASCADQMCCSDNQSFIGSRNVKFCIFHWNLYAYQFVSNLLYIFSVCRSASFFSNHRKFWSVGNVAYLRHIFQHTIKRKLPLSTVDNLFFIQLYGQNLNYDPHLAMDLWWKDVTCEYTKCPNFEKIVLFIYLFIYLFLLKFLFWKIFSALLINVSV